MIIIRCCILLLCVLIISCLDKAEEPAGWMPKILTDDTVYLPDFSYAGYQWGEEALPEHPVTHNVLDYGAVPDDGQDDTEAILQAVAAANSESSTTVVKFPPGKFILKKILFVNRSNFVLRGSGSATDGTVLHIPLAMKDLPLPDDLQELQEYLVKNDKRVKSGELFSPYSWTGAFIWVRKKGERIYPYLPEKDQAPRSLANIYDGKRGGHRFTAESAPSLKPGDVVKILWFNPQGETSTLLDHMYGSGDFAIGKRHWIYPQRPLIQQFVTVENINGNEVTIKEPLLHDLRREWQTILSPARLHEGIGIEHLRIEFPETPYAGHHLEHGYNAIYLTSANNSWVKNVTVVNADNALLSDNCAFVTVDEFSAFGRPGHYGIHLGKNNHMLAKNVLIDVPMAHSISFNTFSKASVYSNVEILQQPTLDQHCGTNHQNLFEDIRIKLPSANTELFKHGGAGYWRPTHGLYNVFWNIRLNSDFLQASDTLFLQEIKDGPGARIVGFYGDCNVQLNYGPDAYQEGINRKGMLIPSLYQYQLAKRLSGRSGEKPR